MSVEELLQEIRQVRPSLSEEERQLITEAYHFAQKCHEGRRRESQCPFFVHPYEVARRLVQMGADVPTICAGLLHDVEEDEGIPNEEIARRFGEVIAKLVEGVTKLEKTRFDRFEEREAENYRKMVVAIARDPRVIVVKLADRLHNMETIQFLEPAKQRRIAKETLEIYAPLAHRLGMHSIRVKLEDLAFKALYPEIYKDIAARVAAKRAEREAYTKEVTEEIRRVLQQHGMKDFTVYGRPKHLYSIWQKMTVRGVPFEQIYDLIGFRVLVPTVNDCYLALGYIHSRWVPVPNRFKDYIALPRSNGYQSLHTTVIDRGRPIEVQIRTYEMDEIAERGLAAHWFYKEAGSRPLRDRDAAQVYEAVRTMLLQLQERQSPGEYLRNIRDELFEEEIFVVTPKGDLKRLPKGATALDFAFYIHTEIGLHATGARVNERLVPLKTELQDGDLVEILTSPHAEPSRDWLRFVKTSRARTAINRWFRDKDFDQHVQEGERRVAEELNEHGLRAESVLTPEAWKRILERLQYDAKEKLLADVGSGKLSAHRIYQLVAPAREPEPHRLRPVRMIGFRIEGSDTVARIAKCCSPLPGDDVVGYITRGRGITVHMRDCPRIACDLDRVVEIEWITHPASRYPAEIIVECDNRTGLLADVTSTIARFEVNIEDMNARTPDSTMAYQWFKLDVANVEQLNQVMQAIGRIRNVRRVRRYIRHRKARESEPAD